MKLISAKNGKRKSGLLFLLLIVLGTFSFVSLTPVFAQQQPQLPANGGQQPLPDTNNADGNDATDTNPGTAWDVRQNYFKRFPYAQDAYNNDVL